jgi:hypothetical protein
MLVAYSVKQIWLSNGIGTTGPFAAPFLGCADFLPQ